MPADGRRLITEVLTEVVDGVSSPLELHWVRSVERPHHLPAATRPFPLVSGQLADGAWADFGVLWKLDGRAYHDGERWFRDWRRDNVSSEDGWLTLRYGWHDTVVGSCATAGNVARVLRRRGWAGVDEAVSQLALTVRELWSWGVLHSISVIHRGG